MPGKRPPEEVVEETAAFLPHSASETGLVSIIGSFEHHFWLALDYVR
jgi:hypothetical protein